MVELVVRVAPDGSARARAPIEADLVQRRAPFERGGETGLELIAWIDHWARASRPMDTLARHGTSLWWFVRTPMFRHLYPQFLDLEVLDQLLRETGATKLRFETADARWIAVGQCVAQRRGIPLVIDQRLSFRRQRLGRALGIVLALAARGLTAPVRFWRQRGARGRSPVLALIYAVSKKVLVEGRVRYMQPTFELPVLALDQRGVPPFKLSAPLNFGWRQEFFWLRHGDRGAVPIEASLLWWLLRDMLSGREWKRWVATQGTAAVARDNELLAEWKGWDVRPLVQSFLVGEFQGRAHRGTRELEFFREFLASRKFKVVLSSGEYSGLAMAMNTAARSLGIRTVAVQHGQIWFGHEDYVWPVEDRGTMPLPDKMCVFGTFERDLLIAQSGFTPDQIEVVGSAHFDLIVNRKPTMTRTQLLRTLDLPTDAPLVLFSSANGDENRIDAERLVEMIAASPTPLAVIVKLHPTRGGEREDFLAEAARHGCRHVRVIQREFDTYDLMQLVDVHASTWSTTLTEAVVFGLPNIMIRTEVCPDTVGYLRREVAVAGERYPSLAAAVEDVLQGEASIRLKGGRAAFVAEQFHRIDGQVSSRVAEVVAGCLR